MKTFTYVAAIALLSAGTAFAQSSDMNSSSSMQKPAQNQSMPRQDQGMSQDRDSGMANPAMSGTAAKQAQSSTERRHVANRARTGGNDARENRETAQLNLQQLPGTGAMGAGGQTAQNPFDRGSPQAPQAGGANCTPDRPDCGTARQNPAIQSSPQQRTYNSSPQ